jgi:tripartite-type tricarboxylate transporter receptor subunit TctC
VAAGNASRATRKNPHGQQAASRGQCVWFPLLERRVVQCLRLFVIALAMSSCAAMAQGYPDKSKPVRIILPQGPGSASDVVTRAFAKAVTEVSGLNVVIDYKPGAETVIGVQALLSAPADGYTLLLVSSSTPVLNPIMIANLPYDALRDFVPLIGISKVMLTFNLGPSTPFKTVGEFVAAAKADPGKYTFASSTTTTRLAGELLQSLAGIRLLNVPYKATAAGATALASGEVDLMIVDASSVRPFWDSGRVRALAVSGATRSTTLPNLPTVREQGVADYDVTAWFATYFAARTPPENVATMREILRKAAKSPGFLEALGRANMDPLDLVGDEISALTRREIDMWTKVVRAANLVPAR